MERAARGVGAWGDEDRRKQVRPAGFHVVPGRRVVERTFAWLSTRRRLSRDDELLSSSEQAWICVSLIRVLLRRPGRPAEASFENTTQARAA